MLNIISALFLFCTIGITGSTSEKRFGLYSLIVKEEVVDPRFNNTDIRFIANTTKAEDIQGQEIQLLQEFANMPKTIAVMICNHQNIDFMANKVTEIQQSNAFVRYYNQIPMILNLRAASLLPKLTERNEKLSAFSVLCINLAKNSDVENNDYRVVFVKDNKSYAQNVAGATEDEDFQNVQGSQEVLRRTAHRELQEEIDLSVKLKKLFSVGIFKFAAEKKLIDTRWMNIFAAFYCCLNKIETSAWLEKSNIGTIGNSLCDCKRVPNNAEVQWLFFVKPELFQNRDIRFPLDDDKTVPLAPLHCDVASAVIQKVLHQNVVIGRGNRHLDGEITYSDVDPLFDDCFRYLERTENIM